MWAVFSHAALGTGQTNGIEHINVLEDILSFWINYEVTILKRLASNTSPKCWSQDEPLHLIVTFPAQMTFL